MSRARELNLGPGYYAYFEVADTGCGMDKPTLKKIFDPFYSTKVAGRGLGLAAVLGIVRGHGGALKVYSQLNQGTTFKVLLPCAQDSMEPESQPRLASDSWTSSATILVADDDESVLTIAKQILEKRGLTVLVARDGFDAVELYEQRRQDIDLVLLDLTMPQMGGEEAFRQMRRIEPDVRVLVTSGYSEEDTMARFAGKGVVDFVPKPYPPGGLVAAVRSALESHPTDDVD